MRNLNNNLLDAGIDRGNWTLREARAVSSDGRHIVGWAKQLDQWGAESAFLISLPPTCPADITGDGVIELADLGVLLQEYGCDNSGEPDQLPCPGDIDSDGDTDIADLAVVLGQYGTECE